MSHTQFTTQKFLNEFTSFCSMSPNSCNTGIFKCDGWWNMWPDKWWHHYYYVQSVVVMAASLNLDMNPNELNWGGQSSYRLTEIIPLNDANLELLSISMLYGSIFRDIFHKRPNSKTFLHSSFLKSYTFSINI